MVGVGLRGSWGVGLGLRRLGGVGVGGAESDISSLVCGSGTDAVVEGLALGLRFGDGVAFGSFRGRPRGFLVGGLVMSSSFALGRGFLGLPGDFLGGMSTARSLLSLGAEPLAGLPFLMGFSAFEGSSDVCGGRGTLGGNSRSAALCLLSQHFSRSVIIASLFLTVLNP